MHAESLDCVRKRVSSAGEDIDGNGIGLWGGCRRVGWIGAVQASDCVRAALRPG